MSVLSDTYDLIRLHALKINSTKSDDAEHTEYLLDAIPRLNSYHIVRLQLQNSDEKISVGQRLKLENDKIYIINKFIEKHFPNLKPIDEVTKNEDVYTSKCCGVAYIQDTTGDLICKNCGHIEAKNAISFNDPSKNLSYSRSLVKQKSYSYKRLNHFREFLRQIQGKSKTSVHATVLVALKKQFEKYRISRNEVTPKIVRKFLRKNKHSTQYEHSISIAKAINPNVKPVNLPPAYVEKLCLYFLNLDHHFDKIKSKVCKARKNFLSYSYTFFKLNELLGEHQFNRDVKLLKSVDLTLKQDRYWMFLMKELKWKNFGRTLSI